MRFFILADEPILVDGEMEKQHADLADLRKAVNESQSPNTRSSNEIKEEV